MAPRLGHEGSGFLSVEDNEALRRVFAYPENCVMFYVCVVCVVCGWCVCACGVCVCLCVVCVCVNR